MTGKNAIITGANTGIGLEIAKKLASMNAVVFLACRNLEKANVAKTEILTLYPSAKVHVLALDLASLASVRQFEATWSAGRTDARIDVLVHNAGLAFPESGHEFTGDGFEAVYQTNVLGHFLLTHLLERHLVSDARVVILSSSAAYTGWISNDFGLTKTTNKIEYGFHTGTHSSQESAKYFQSKTMGVAFGQALQNHFDRDPSHCRLALVFEPGVVLTSMVHSIVKFTAANDLAYAITYWLGQNTSMSVEQGAATGIYLCVSKDPAVKTYRGRYWSARTPRLTAVDFYPPDKLDKLWIRWSADAEITWT